MDYPPFLLYVRCLTFNHSSYICDTLDGFCIQKTKFPFICAIVDDASTDGEPEIINQYLRDNFNLDDPKITRKEETENYFFTFAQHKENKNCFFAVYLLKYNHYNVKKSKLQYLTGWSSAKYSALCEGDDYWVSPHKLQLQVDFLESHPKHSLCFHAYYSLRGNGSKREIHRYAEYKECCPISEMILKGGSYMATASMVYVTKMIDDWPDWAMRAPVKDAPLMLVLADRGRVAYINEVMSCYRVDVPGSWSVRISKNSRKRKEVHSQIQLYKKGFDKWTNYKYHKYVRKALFISNMHYYVNTLPIVRKVIKYLRRTR